MKHVYSIYLAPTYKCNDKCKVCPVYSKRKSFKDLPLEYLIDYVEETINKLPKIIPIRVEISGGEPLLYSNIKQLIQYLCENRRVNIVSILSNLELMSYRSFYERIKNYLCVDKLNLVTTIYSNKDTVHDSISQNPGSFQRKMNALYQLYNDGIRVHIKTLITKISYKDLIDIFLFVYDNFYQQYGDLVSFSIHGLDLRDQALIYKKELGVRYIEAKRYIEELFDYIEEHNIKLNTILYTFPLCVLDPYYWKYIGFSEPMTQYLLYLDATGEVAKNTSNKRIVSDKCKQCVLNKVCPIPWDTYFETFGDLEFSPFSYDAKSKMLIKEG